jgi:hypothetical protein
MAWRSSFLSSLIPAGFGLLALLPWAGFSGEYHTGGTLICYDCHTMHFSETQGVAPNDPYGTGAPEQFPLTTGPNPYLLRQPQNNICLSCHDGKTSAPDVLGVNVNTSPSQGRQAGALNTAALGAPYEAWKGHTLFSTTAPPGYNPSLVGLADWYNGTTWGLKCIHCHVQHATPAPYRNLGAYALGSTVANFQPTYVIASANDPTKDVWINIASQTGTVGSRTAAEFNPYYDAANISFNRIDGTVGSSKTSNKLDSFCAACHANFHGGPANPNIGANPGALDGFIRHPTAQVTIGASGAQGYGGHSALSRYTGATTRVKVLASDRAAYSDATPGCVTCHKAHGNQNPFGLVFLNRNATTVGEQGGYGAGQVEMANGYGQGYRNLCGQCHSQGN